MQNIKRHLHVFSTGGTIEKIYIESEGTLENKASVIKDALFSKMRLPYTDINLEVILAKDSLHMNENDREIILNHVNEAQMSGYPIIILHGTDTMEITAKYLWEKLTPKVPIILTGAMKPIGFEDSDAKQNVIEAMTCAFLVKPGVYISFHGKLFHVPHVKKNHEEGTFEETEHV